MCHKSFVYFVQLLIAETSPITPDEIRQYRVRTNPHFRISPDRPEF